MSSTFELVASCEILDLYVNEMVPGAEYTFPLSGEPVGDLVRPPNVPVQLSGRSAARYADGTEVEYTGFCVPYPFPGQPLLYPPGDSVSQVLEPGQYACFTGKVPLDFEMLTEPAERELAAGTCIACLTGPVTVAGVEVEPMQIARVSEAKTVSIASEHPVFIVWAR